MTEKRSTAREGVIAGFLGATSIVLWFGLVDALAGHAYRTPIVLGQALFGFFGPGTGETTATLVLGYTAFHYAAFAALGVLLSWVFRQAEREPSVLAGAILAFVMFEIGFYGLTALLSETELLGHLAWYQVGAANLVAAALMGGYLLHEHPIVVKHAAYALGGRE